MRKNLKCFLALVTVILASTLFSNESFAKDVKKETDSKVEKYINAVGVYQNWDGVSNVAQFTDKNGNFCFAYDGDKYVTVVRTNANGSIKKGQVKLEKKHSIFGTVLCDEDGYFYLVTGEKNSGTDTSKETVFISKYTSKGKHVATVGDNGSSSLAYYYDSSFYTQTPFDGGACSAAINNGVISVNYARHMYSGHQSNSVFSVDTASMKKVDTGVFYNSHSFAQRVAPFKEGFVYASEGDCYSRAFTVITDTLYNSGKEKDIFHFWVEKGTLDKWDMWTLNNNFAHMGGLVNLNDKAVAFVGTSVKSLSSDAKKEKEQLFVQIFDPEASSNTSGAYTTTGTRSGLGGPNGDESVTDYGVKWLSPDNYKYDIKNPQVVAVDDKLVVLFEKYSGSKFVGTYYMVVSNTGKILKKFTLYSKTAKLNPCTMPVNANGKICWAGNKTSGKNVYIFSLEIE